MEDVLNVYYLVSGMPTLENAKPVHMVRFITQLKDNVSPAHLIDQCQLDFNVLAAVTD